MQVGPSVTGRCFPPWELLPALTQSKKGSVVAARTIPFPTPPGNVATRVSTSYPPPPPTSAAKLISAPRRYRGLHLVPEDQLHKMTHQLNRLAQTQAIVAQVEREVAERAMRDRNRTELVVLEPVKKSAASVSGRTAHRLVMSLFPAGL